MKSQQQLIGKLKAKLEKEHGRTITDDEAIQAHWFAERIANILSDSSRLDATHKKKLEETPKGFHLEGSFTCLVCGLSAANENSWYDKNGIKCMFCQKAMDKKLIPKSVINNRDSWYSTYDLERYFNIDRGDLTKYVKSGLLKKRIVASGGRNPHLELFLVRDNKETLPPKKLLRAKLVKVTKDSEELFTNVEWYEFIDEKAAKKFLKYKILEIVKETLSKPILSRRIYFRSTHLLFSIRD